MECRRRRRRREQLCCCLCPCVEGGRYDNYFVGLSRFTKDVEFLFSSPIVNRPPLSFFWPSFFLRFDRRDISILAGRCLLQPGLVASSIAVGYEIVRPFFLFFFHCALTPFYFSHFIKSKRTKFRNPFSVSKFSLKKSLEFCSVVS